MPDTALPIAARRAAWDQLWAIVLNRAAAQLTAEVARPSSSPPGEQKEDGGTPPAAPAPEVP